MEINGRNKDLKILYVRCRPDEVQWIDITYRRCIDSRYDLK